jgi:hypothetical protein
VIRRVVVSLCDQCIRGEGEMCHNPGCLLCRHRVDLPIMEELLEDVTLHGCHTYIKDGVCIECPERPE